MIDAKEKQVVLINKKKNDERVFTLRPFVYGDEASVVECVREEYADTYYRREYYEEKLLLQEIEKGKLLLFLACDGEKTCGFQSLIRHVPYEGRIEAASQIFKKEYRGYSLPIELVKYTYEIAKAYNPGCIYASTVVFHNITQKMCEEVGMIPVAFNLGSHLSSAMHNSYALGKSEKYAQAILILPVGRHDCGMVFLHRDIAKKAEMLYSNLGVVVDIVTSLEKSEESGNESLPRLSKMDVLVNEREQSISIAVDSIGEDFLGRVEEVKKGHAEKYWTIQLILPVDRPEAIMAYEKLACMGFYFTGIRPLCSEHEQIFLQYTGDVYFCFEYSISAFFAISRCRKTIPQSCLPTGSINIACAYFSLFPRA